VKDMKAFSLIIATLLLAIIVSGCFGGLGDINRTARPALTKQYLDYLNDKNERQRVDDEWLDSVEVFKNAGWKKPSHPWGDKSLTSMGIPKVKSHKYSNQ
jgi:hypothetical protein